MEEDRKGIGDPVEISGVVDMSIGIEVAVIGPTGANHGGFGFVGNAIGGLIAHRDFRMGLDRQ